MLILYRCVLKSLQTHYVRIQQNHYFGVPWTVWSVRVINEMVTRRNSRTLAGKCVLHTYQAGCSNSDAVGFYLESIQFRSQLRCSAILTSFPRLSLFHGRTLLAGNPTHKNVSSTIFLSLLRTRKNLLISFETVTFSGERISSNILRLNSCFNKTSSDVSVSNSSLPWNRRDNNNFRSEK